MNNKKTHSQTLLPMLDEIVKAADIDMSEIDAIAVSRGPGSFTGLRIGSATAKGLGLALNKPLIEVPTLDAMAYNVYGICDDVVCPIMDARRQEVYYGIYDFQNANGRMMNQETAPTALALHTIAPEGAGPLTEVLETLNEVGRHVFFLGDGVPVYKDVIAQNLKVGYTFVPEHLSRQRAGSVAALGLLMLKNGCSVSAADHAPTYLRVSQAERERNAQN